MDLLGYFKNFFKRKPTEIETDLLAMIALLAKEENWCQGTMSQYDDKNKLQKCCLYGAWLSLRKTKGNIDSVKNILCHKILNGAPFYDGQQCRIMTKWNDDPKRTHAEVLGLLTDTLKDLGWKL